MSTLAIADRVPQPPSDEALNLGDAAKLVDKSSRAIRYRIDTGDLAAVEYDGQLWVSRAELLDFYTPRPHVPSRVPVTKADPQLQQRWEHLSSLVVGGGSS